MFVRVETGYRAEFVDPEARRIQQKIAEIHPQLAEKIRWVRRLKCYWFELDAPRDKVIQTIQQVFRTPVTHWLFTGDLLPSAAGSLGTLQDLMQASPSRPGVFHGIEKRKRINVHSEDAKVLRDVFKTVLGNTVSSRSSTTSPSAAITGELLLIEGSKLTQSDLEWVAKHWFAEEKTESWSLISEDELKKNARFQSEQVAKYLTSAPVEARSRLLQFRQMGQSSGQILGWPRIEELFRITVPIYEKHSPPLREEEWFLHPTIRFASDLLLNNTGAETEFHLALQQLETFAEGFPARLQTLLGVLPNTKRIWFGESNVHHPIRVRDEFENTIKLVSETTATPIVQMKLYEDMHEHEPAYFWSSSLGISNQLKEETPTQNSELIWIGDDQQPAFQDLIFVQNLKASLQYAQDAMALSFVLSCSGLTLLEVLKRAAPLSYGFNLVIDDKMNWFQKALETPMSLSQIWGVREDQKGWLFEELKLRGIPFFHLGSTNLSGDVQVFEKGSIKLKMTIKDFFKTAVVVPEEALLDEPLFAVNNLSERRIQSVKFKNRYSVEELILKPEVYHASIASPVVLRPDPNLWTGVMVLSDLCGEEFSVEYMEYLLRKCTALGGQIQSMQISMLNGLKSWYKIIQEVKSEFGIQLSQLEILVRPQNGAHWLALQLIARMNDIRNIRSEDFKQAHDRIYWLPGGFDHPATRWLAGMEGRYQNSLRSAIAIEPADLSLEGDPKQGVINTLIFALVKRKLGAELRLQHYFPGGFFVSIGENERYSVEEEWQSMGIEFEWVGKVTSTPHLVVRDEDEKVNTISIEDLV